MRQVYAHALFRPAFEAFPDLAAIIAGFDAVPAGQEMPSGHFTLSASFVRMKAHRSFVDPDVQPPQG